MVFISKLFVFIQYEKVKQSSAVCLLPLVTLYLFKQVPNEIASKCSLCRAYKICKTLAAVSCSSDAPRLGGVGLGSGMTGKLGCAWLGAWVLHGCVHEALTYVNIG